MTYKILANKWRPKGLNEIIGQDQIIYTIKNIIKNKKIHHSYIISGPQGIGKTTLARVIIKCLNCEARITLSPCNNCFYCKTIDINKNIDSLEIDAASKTKVEDIKDIIDSMKYINSNNRYKTFIIDECHMLSINSFNYLLKILEEPFDNTIFILITTQLEKIPSTIISRCINLKLNKISKKNIKKHLATILTKENIKYNNLALDYIGIFCNGSLREAFNIIEQTIKDNEIKINDTILSLGILSDLNILFLIKNIIEQDIINLIKNIKYITTKNLNFKNIIIQIQFIIYKIFLFKNNIRFDNTIIKYKIFIYLSKKINHKNINTIYFNLLKKQNNYLNLTELDFEMILINLVEKIKLKK